MSLSGINFPSVITALNQNGLKRIPGMSEDVEDRHKMFVFLAFMYKSMG